MQIHRRALAKGLTATSLVAALGVERTLAQATPAASPDSSGETREIVHPRGTSVIPANPQRVINLGEEWLLADMLELGIRPIATTATYVDGFVGIDADYEPEVPLFTTFEIDIESLIPLEADLIVSQDYLFDLSADLYETLSQIAPVVSIPRSADWHENYLTLAAVFGKEAEAQATIDALEDEIAATAVDLDLTGRTVSFATVYPGGDGFALWLTGANPIVDVVLDLGAEVLPSAEGYDLDANGRAWMSLEQVSEIQGETLIMLQTFAVEAEGETEAFDEVTGTDLWQTVPAVQNDRVFIIERVGFPGEVAGRRGILDAYREIFG